MDKYTAVWVSHSSMGDFLKCPRGYYLHNMYKDPATGRKMSIVTPHMSLGIAVHEVLEALGDYPAGERMTRDLRADFENEWLKVSGIKGGFLTPEQEEEFKMRGKEMINNVIKDPRFLVNKRVKLPKEKMNPNFYLSEDENIILNGQVDWIEYLPDLPAPRPGQFCIYVLKCADDSFYIGQTDNYERRLKQHENGEGADWTKNHLPFEPIHWEIFNTREEAVKREHDLKTGFGRKWLKREYEKGTLSARQAGGTLHIVDFKTGKNEEKDGSLQLPIYLLLCNALRPQWPVSKASYWYLESDKMVEKELPDVETSYRDVLDVARRVKEARDVGDYHCPKGDFDPETGEGGCSACRPYEKILQFKAGKLMDDSARLPDQSERGQVISVGIGGFNQDMFVIK